MRDTLRSSVLRHAPEGLHMLKLSMYKKESTKSRVLEFPTLSTLAVLSERAFKFRAKASKQPHDQIGLDSKFDLERDDSCILTTRSELR